MYICIFWIKNTEKLFICFHFWATFSTTEHHWWRNNLFTLLRCNWPPYHLDKASARPLLLPGMCWTARSISYIAVTSHMFLATVPGNRSQEQPELSEQTTAILLQRMATALRLSLCFHKLSVMYTLIISRWTLVHGIAYVFYF